MKRRYLFFCILFLWNLLSNAQIIAPDTVCTDEIFSIEYSGVPANSFCLIPNVNSFSQDISIDVVGEFPEGSFPLFSHTVVDGENHYVFTTLSAHGDLVRSDFGNSFSNTPTQTVFTLDEIPSGQEGIQVINDNGHWWGFIIGGNIDFFGPEYLVRLDFGSSLTNTPIVENLGNIGNLYFPHDLVIIKENDNWIGLTINRLSSSITRFEFGNSLGNIPIGTNLGNIGQLYRPTGFHLIEVDEEWHLFIVSTVGNSLSRIDFGTSLLNTPTGVNLGNGSGLFDLPRDLVITKICDNYFGLLANRTNGEIVLLDFGNDIQNNFFGVSYGSFDGVVYPHAITSFRVSSGNVSFFIVDVESAKLNRLSFDTSVGTIFCGSAIDEVEISYFQPGEYALQLITDEGTPGQNSFCKNIVVIPSPDLNIGSDTILCFGETIELESSSSQTIWQGEVESDIYEVEEEGIIYASLSEGQCTTMDTLEVVFEDCESCFQLPNVFTPDGDMNNDEFRAIINCNVEIIDYQITIFNRWGQKVFSSNNVLTAWNGGYKDSSCPSDVYVWKLFFSYKKSGQVFEKIDSGDITLIR